MDPRAPAVPRGERGELLIRGPQVMQGYLNAPAKTAETLLEDGWLRTGDVVTMDDDGCAALKCFGIFRTCPLNATS